MEIKNNIKLGRKQLWLTPHEFEEGIDCIKQNNIKDLFLWYGTDTSNEFHGKELTLDFSWLKKVPNIVSIEMMLKLTAKSNIESFYSLSELEKLTYFNYDKLPLEHKKIKKLNSLYTHYSKEHLNNRSKFESIENLKFLKLWHIKQEDCTFLGNLNKLEQLELTWSRKLKSLLGCERFMEMKSLNLINLYTLVNIEQLHECRKLSFVKIEGCKNINEEGQCLIEKINESE